MASPRVTTPPSAPDPPIEETIDVSVVIPCLHEEENSERCVTLARDGMERHGIRGEVVVGDIAGPQGRARARRRRPRRP